MLIKAKTEQKILPHSTQQLQLPDDGKRMLGVHREPCAHPGIANNTQSGGLTPQLKERDPAGVWAPRGRGAITRSPSARCLCRCFTLREQ